jgi:hypothetical protein
MSKINSREESEDYAQLEGLFFKLYVLYFFYIYLNSILLFDAGF